MNNKLVLYTFTYPEHIERPKIPGKVIAKVGDTTQGLDDGLTFDESGKIRIDQQGTSAEAYGKVIGKTWGVDKKVIKRDHDVHRILKLQGRRPAYLNGMGKEWFEFDGNSIEDVNKHLDGIIKNFGISANQKIKLRKEQKRVLKETFDIIEKTDSDKVHIAWSIAPRGGKTPTALKTFAESGKKVMILPSAWLSSHTSFRDDILNFADFDDMVYVETAKNDNYKQEIDEALERKQKVVVSVSLHAKDKRYFKPLKEIYNDDKFVVVDEGDFASWTPKKRKILNYILDGKNVGGKMIIISMSGTNIPRMVTGCDKLDGLVHVTYMGLEQTEKDIVKRRYFKLKLDKTDKYVKQFTKDDMFLPKKVIADAYKSSDFIQFRQDGFLGKASNSSYKGLNLWKVLDEQPRCIQEWVLPERNSQLDDYANVLRGAMPKWRVEVLNSNYTSNKKAQEYIRTAIEEAKRQGQDGVWIVSNTMGSRSFSIPEIQATIISYDNGDDNATDQKAYRSISPGKKWDGTEKQYGHIITLSIDPNRDTRATDMLTREAAIQSQITGQPLPAVVKTLLKNVSIFGIDEHDNIAKLDPEDLKKEMQETETLRKVAFALSKPDNILKDEILLNEFMNMKFGKKKNKKELALLPKANAFLKNKQKKLSKKKQQSIMNNVVKRIKLLCDSSSMVAVESNGETFKECLNNFDKDRFNHLFGIEPKSIIRLLDKDVLPEKLLDIIISNTNNIIKSGDINKFHELDTIGVYPQLGIVKSSEKSLWLKKLKNVKDIKNKKIVSVGTTMGHEVAALLELGVPKKNITIIDKNGFSKLWENAGIEYINKPIEEMKDMKFDLCVGNPPFSEGNTGKGGTSIYQNFVEWALKNCKEVMMITPGSFMTGNAKKFKDMRESLNAKGLSCIEDIPLDVFSGASIVNPKYWVANGGTKKVEDFYTKEKKLFDKIIDNNIDKGPFECYNGRPAVSTSNFVNISKTKTPTHQFKFIDRVLKDGPVEVYCDKKLTMPVDKYLTVFAQRGGMSPKMFLYHNKETFGFSINVMGISIKNETQHNNLVKLFSTNVFKFMLDVITEGATRTRKGMPAGFTKQKLETLPALDLDVSWTDAKVNKALKLSDDDIEVINKYVA